MSGVCIETVIIKTACLVDMTASRPVGAAMRAEHIEIFLVMTIIVSWFNHKYFSPIQT